jgi:hypothetical protein
MAFMFLDAIEPLTAKIAEPAENPFFFSALSASSAVKSSWTVLTARWQRPARGELE